MECRTTRTEPLPTISRSKRLDDANEAYVESPQTPGSKRRYLAAFVVTVVVVVIVLGLLPSALVSMYRELRGQAIDSVYDLFTGHGGRLSTRPLAPTRRSSTSP